MSDLDWLAFRYAAGELGAAEAGAFEARLVNDQAAREAVSRAVALGLELSAARPAIVSMTGPSGQRRRTIGWVLATTAASLALALCGYFAIQDWPGRQPGAMAAAGVPAVDAAVWLRLQGLGDSADRLQSEFDDWESNELEDLAASPVIVPPQWLLDLSLTGNLRGKHDEQDRGR